MPSLSIILPIHNEALILEKSVNQLIRAVNSLKILKKWELILIENGSRDQSWSQCKKLYHENKSRLKIYNLKKASFGNALKFGILKANYKYIAIVNVDFWRISFLKTALSLIEFCDIVVGSKTLIKAQDLRPYYRRIFSYYFNVFLRLVYNFPGTDTHGLKLLRAKTMLPLVRNCYPLNELFDTQLVLHACRHNLIYTELPVTVKEIRPTRYSNIKRFYNLFHDLFVIFKYRYL